jgi:hypothetical protein
VEETIRHVRIIEVKKETSKNPKRKTNVRPAR